VGLADFSKARPLILIKSFKCLANDLRMASERRGLLA
jgi:hypothetical protein